MEDNKELIKGEKDWSDLPSELVYLIAKKLPNLRDCICVHVTCKSWCSATPLAEFSMNLPWLLEFPQEARNIVSLPTTRLSLYSMFSGEALTIPVKESRWFRGSSNGYLPFVDDCTGIISLFNPLTNDEFAVPLIHNQHDGLSSLMIWTEPGPIRDYRTIIVEYGNSTKYPDRWAMYDPHHGKWSEHEGFDEMFMIFSYYCRGMFFYTYEHTGGETIVIDAFSKSLLYTIPPHLDELTHEHLHGEELMYIRYFISYVVNSTGEILRVIWYYPKEFLTESSKFRFYRLNFGGLGGQPCWDKINGIGDQVLFLEALNNISRAANGLLMAAAPANGLRGGHIYFIDPYNGKPYVYDIGSGIAKMISCPFEKRTWFFPKP